MDYTTLKTAIDANINTNGNQEITGAVLNSVLNQMVDDIQEQTEDELGSIEGHLNVIDDFNSQTSQSLTLLNSGLSTVRNRVSTLETSMTDAQTDIVSIKNKNNVQDESITALQQRMTSAESEIVSIDNHLDIIDNFNNQTTSKIESIEDILSKAYQVYGIRHNYNASSPTLTRIGNLDLHRTLPVQSKMRRCILDDNGNVVYYLDRNDSTLREDGQAAVLDGTHGQVMVEIPEHYRACIEDTSNGTYDVLISLTPFTGARKIKKTYVSAFEAVVDRTDSSNLKLSSVRNLTEAFRGGNNNAAYDGTYRSFLGMPTTVVSLTNFRTYANNRGENWHQYDWEAHCAIYWLFAIEYATLNSQATFNADLDANGYHQGGLGVGVTNMNGDKWNAYNGYYPFVPCGYTLSLGDATGIVPLTFNAEQEVAYGAAYTTDVPSYRGIENPFGHIWKWVDGFLGLGDGVAQDVYVCRDKAHYASTLNDYYQKLGKYPEGTDGYPRSLVRNEYGDLFFPTMGGGSTTYFCDYNYRQVAEGTIYGLYVGGPADNGSYAGLACLTSHTSPSYSGAAIGSRLCWSAE